MRSVVTIVVALGALCAYGGETNFPWEDLKALYQANITRDLTEAEALRRAAQVVTLDEARYRLHIRVDRVEGEVELSGRLVSGEPKPVPLFGPELVIREAGEVTGATLLPGAENGGLSLLPDSGAVSFHMVATFLVRSTEERGAHSLTLAIPRAVENRVQLQFDDGLRLLEAPGIAGPEGEYYLAPTGVLALRYALASAAQAAQAPEVDLFTRVIVSQRRVLLETHGVPVRALPEAALLHLPAGAQLVNTTLKPSEFMPREGGTYSISSSTGAPQPFVVESVIAIPEDGSALSFVLPAIEGNAGREGRFLVVEPEDGQAVVQGENLITHIPVAQLGEAFPATGATHFMRMPSGQPVTLAITRFQAQDVTDTVLESQVLHVSFDETGRSLSTLRLVLPAGDGPRLVLDPVAGSEIWSLQVNGASRQVYTDANGAWVIPLDAGQVSNVELAFLREGEPVGLHGTLDVEVPRTGLGAKTLYVGVQLPGRVELMSVEGPVNTSVASEGSTPEGLAGVPYLFTQPFYKGEGMRISVLYREPVNNTK